MTLVENKSAFALDNDGFRYALATAQGADLKRFVKEADESWKKSRIVVLEIIKEIKNMEAITVMQDFKLDAVKKSPIYTSKSIRISNPTKRPKSMWQILKDEFG